MRIVFPGLIPTAIIGGAAAVDYRGGWKGTSKFTKGNPLVFPLYYGLGVVLFTLLDKANISTEIGKAWAGKTTTNKDGSLIV